MNRRKAVAVLSLASLASAQTKRYAIRNKFAGVWKLVSWTKFPAKFGIPTE